MILLQLRICLADNQDLYPRISYRTAYRLVPNSVRLASAPRPAIRRVQRPAHAEQLLLRRQLPQLDVDAANPAFRIRFQRVLFRILHLKTKI